MPSSADVPLAHLALLAKYSITDCTKANCNLLTTDCTRVKRIWAVCISLCTLSFMTKWLPYCVAGPAGAAKVEGK